MNHIQRKIDEANQKSELPDVHDVPTRMECTEHHRTATVSFAPESQVVSVRTCCRKFEREVLLAVSKLKYRKG